MDHDLSGPLECFVDSDHAADKDTRRSCTGYVFFSRGGPISWRSRLQNSTALSTLLSLLFLFLPFFLLFLFRFLFDVFSPPLQLVLPGRP